MTDYKQLIARLCDELDHYRQLLADDRREVHLLATEARAALAQPSHEGVLTDEELLRMAAKAIEPYDTIKAGEYEAENELAIEAYGSELIAFARAVEAAVIARRPAPAPPAEDRCLTVGIEIDTSPDSIGRLCDALVKTVRPGSGYRALTSDDLKPGEEITGGAGEQIVGVEWWLPQLGCDSLEQTLDSIKERITLAVRDWWKTAFVTTTLVDPPAEGEVAELVKRVQQRQHPQPVPVSERLLGASDTRYEFSVVDADYVEQAGGSARTYAQALSEGRHYLAQYKHDGPHTLEIRRVEVTWRISKPSNY